ASSRRPAALSQEHGAPRPTGTETDKIRQRTCSTKTNEKHLTHRIIRPCAKADKAGLRWAVLRPATPASRASLQAQLRRQRLSIDAAVAGHSSLDRANQRVICPAKNSSNRSVSIASLAS